MNETKKVVVLPNRLNLFSTLNESSDSHKPLDPEQLYIHSEIYKPNLLLSWDRLSPNNSELTGICLTLLDSTKTITGLQLQSLVSRLITLINDDVLLVSSSPVVEV